MSAATLTNHVVNLRQFYWLPVKCTEIDRLQIWRRFHQSEAFRQQPLLRAGCCVYPCRCWKDCSFSDVFSFKFDKNKSIFFAEKGFNLVYTLWILFFYAKLNDQLTHSDHRQSHLQRSRYFDCLIFFIHCIYGSHVIIILKADLQFLEFECMPFLLYIYKQYHA